MKIICTQENLKTGVASVFRIISPNNTLPILGNILLKTENGLLKISATNLEIAITTEVRCKIEEEGSITVFSKTFTDLINNLPNQNITLETVNGELVIKTENYNTNIKTLPPEEFPLIPDIEDPYNFSLDAGLVKQSVDQVLFAVSTNQTQPELSGMFMDVYENGVNFAATDRYRLAEKKVSSQKNLHSQQVIIPQKTMAEVSRLASGYKGSVDISLNNTQISFSLGATRVVSRLIDGQYPAYQDIVPKNFKTTILVGKNALVNALRTGGIFTQSSSSIQFSYSAEKNILMVISQSQDLGKSEVSLPCSVEGQDGGLVLNYHYVLDCLPGMETENILIKINDDNSPSIVVPEGRDDYMYLVMPIKG